MDKIAELKQRKVDLVTQMESLLNKADEEKRSLSDEETAQYAGMDKSLGDLTVTIERYEKIEAEKAELAKIVRKAPAIIIPGKTHDDTEFRNIGEFVFSVITNRSDKRLEPLRIESRAQQVGDSTLGGYMVPPQFSQTILSVAPDQAVVRPRATITSTGDLQELSIPVLDQTSARNIYGGFSVYHTGEQTAVTEQNVYLRRVTLKPRKIMGYTTLTNELLSDWNAASPFIQNQMRLCVTGTEDYDFLRGDGVNKPLGIIESPASVRLNRTTANQIAYADLVGMLARFRGTNGVWVAAPSTIPQLANVRDTNNNNLWITAFAGASTTMPAQIFGKPLIFSERLPALGSKGDIILIDASNYLVCDGTGLRIELSQHFLFNQDMSALKIVWFVDGQPWLSEPILAEGDSTLSLSPFVVLDVP